MEQSPAEVLIEQIQQMPEDKQAHFRLTVLGLMRCYTDDNVSGALLMHYHDECRSAIISLGMDEQHLIDDLSVLLDVLTNPESNGSVTIQ